MDARIVIDVEMCGVRLRENAYPYKREIIQIGAVMLDEEYKIIDKYSTFVRPRYGKIDRFILKLTGISDRSIKDAPDIEDVLIQMLEWIGEKEAVFYSWSPSDFYQIRNEICLKCKDSSRWGILLDQANWIDYQQKLGERLGARNPIKLSEALLQAEIDICGRLHDGLDDAYNTALLIAKLEVQKDYLTLTERARAIEADQEPLLVSLGSLLQGIAPVTA